MNWAPPVLIYQMGKVGSTSIQTSLSALKLPSIHAHFLSWRSLKEVENYYLTIPHAIIPEHIDRSKRLRALMDETWGRIRWKVITLVRDPVARTISDVFQNLAFTEPQMNGLAEKDAAKRISACTLEQFHNFDEKRDYVCTWFDKEIKDVFNYDIYALEFSKIKGYQIFKARNADILVVKLEKLSECHRHAFQDFLGIPNLQLKTANVGTQKPYRRLYKNVLDRISIPQHYLECVYSTRFVKHFYTREEIQFFKRRWAGQPGRGSRLESNGCKAKTSPSAIPILKGRNRKDLSHSNRARKFHHPTFFRPIKTGDQQNLPKISLVTPSYNQGKYLHECIDSVLIQNYPNLEYVIMDGGSTDDSVEIIKKYEKHLTFWQSRPDGGQYAAIDEGFRKTTGEIMTWLNSDDIFHPNAFFTVAGLFLLRNDVEWITGRSNTLDEQGKQYWICEYLTPFARLKYLKKEFMNPCIQQEGTFWRRRLWQRAGSSMRIDLDFAGDLELWTRFFRYSRLYSADALLAGYRLQPKSKAQLFMNKYLQEANRILDRELKLFQVGIHKESLPQPDPIKLEEIRKGLELIQGLYPAIQSFIDRQGGRVTFKDGHQAALEFYERSVASKPNDAIIRNSLGMLYWQSGEVKKAITEFIIALRKNQSYPAAVMNLGDVLTRIKEKNLAAKLYAAYLSINPGHKKILKSFAKIDC